MTPIPAKVLTVAKQSSQFRVLVQIELDKYLGSFRSLRSGERKPFTGSCYHGQLDLFTTEITALKRGSRSRSGRLCDLVMQNPQNESQRQKSLRHVPVRQPPDLDEL
jgi:hypothetical protein